jgi:ANTAR domain
VIAQSTMERHGVTAAAAFGVLSLVSQAENMKLAEIARQLVETGELPAYRAQRPFMRCPDV